MTDFISDNQSLMLLRGIPERHFKNNSIIGPVKNRMPRKTPLWIHQTSDQWFYDNFGIRYRSTSLFCTGDESIAKIYGIVCSIYPATGFRCCWSPSIKDFYVESFLNFFETGDTAAVIKFLEQGNYRENGLKDAIDSKNEIMVSASNFFVRGLMV